MILVKLTAYDKEDLLKYLDLQIKVLEKKPDKKYGWDNKKYDINRINYLKKVINGEVDNVGYARQPKITREKPSKRYYVPQDKLLDLGFDDEV